METAVLRDLDGRRAADGELLDGVLGLLGREGGRRVVDAAEEGAVGLVVGGKRGGGDGGRVAGCWEWGVLV